MVGALIPEVKLSSVGGSPFDVIETLSAVGGGRALTSVRECEQLRVAAQWAVGRLDVFPVKRELTDFVHLIDSGLNFPCRNWKR